MSALVRSGALATGAASRAPSRPEILPRASSVDAFVGTFKDNKSAPIHRWFQYPAGFSYRAVEHALETFPVPEGGTVYDPFAGTGTTLVVCKGRGISSVGVEAHPLVARIAQTKVTWDLDLDKLGREADALLRSLPRRVSSSRLPRDLPALLQKCYSPKNLTKLFAIRDALDRVEKVHRDLFEVALIGTLRAASAAATGWPYIAPRKRIQEKDALETFALQLSHCLEDLRATRAERRTVPARALEADARAPPLGKGSVDLAFTSPPYLNNYDYADRLRLETYFLGMASTWGEITERFRSKLIVAATTQVDRREGSARERVEGALEGLDPQVARELGEKVEKLSEVRKHRRGQKSYDLMVARYFEDMAQAMTATRRLLRPEGRLVMILGDSAPYGVPIPTEEYLGKLGLGVGFSDYRTTRLRSRGGKWRSNPQRHHVPLKESWLLLRA
ncbi:MAG: hypothetical protein KGJ23_06340 [Euryarchaeota archaeon]|nr:hypothetical protein [Euryarchaeota archaeon]MDE1836219.1 hypothetical protein [Euryarchaeota archaeon]MDE1880872.1 hypothetical protein [Euryarchaeota archaeon]MDE2045020.1 hypothetical protein [Thermoplasmata archaeon]